MHRLMCNWVNYHVRNETLQSTAYTCSDAIEFVHCLVEYDGIVIVVKWTICRMVNEPFVDAAAVCKNYNSDDVNCLPMVEGIPTIDGLRRGRH